MSSSNRKRDYHSHSNSDQPNNSNNNNYNNSSSSSSKSLITNRIIIDRDQICPFLLRVFVKEGAHHSSDDFAVFGSEPKQDQLIIYTWKDASFGELTKLIQSGKKVARMLASESSSSSSSSSPRLSFCLVYPDKTGKHVLRKVAETSLGEGKTNWNKSKIRGRGGQENEITNDEEKCLLDVKFEIGDFLDVALLT